MRQPILLTLLFCAAIGIITLQSCKDDSYLKALPADTTNYSFTEEFDTTSAALSRGWSIINKSIPLGSSIWQDGGGIPAFFNSYSNNGSNVGFIGVDYLSTSGEPGIINQWLVSPLVHMQNGDKIVFYTKALTYPGYIDDNPDDTTDFGNSLEVRINTTGAGAQDVGEGTTRADNGSFKTGLLVINPNYYEWHNSPGDYPLDGGPSSTDATIAQAYPVQWTRFEATITGLQKAVDGRFAFRYYVANGGNLGRASGVGIDAVSYISVH